MTDLAKTSGTSPPRKPRTPEQRAVRAAAARLRRATHPRTQTPRQVHRTTGEQRADRQAKIEAQWLVDHPGLTLEDRRRGIAAKKRRLVRQRFGVAKKNGRLRVLSGDAAAYYDFDEALSDSGGE